MGKLKIVPIINKTMKPLSTIAIIDGIILIASIRFMNALDYLYWESEDDSLKLASSTLMGCFIIDILEWVVLISAALLTFIISVRIIRKIKNKVDTMENDKKDI